MRNITRVVGSLLLLTAAWPLIGMMIPIGFWLPVALMPLMWNWRSEEKVDPSAAWVDEIEEFLNQDAS